MSHKDRGHLYVLLGVCLILIVFLNLHLFITMQASDQEQEVGVGNAAPTADNVYIATNTEHNFDSANHEGTVSPIDNSLKTVYVYGEVTDNNGCTDLLGSTSNWEIVLYRSSVSGAEACTLDNNECYELDTSSNLTLAGCSGEGDLTANFEGSLDLAYWADQTVSGAYAADNWVAWVKPFDVNVAEGTPATGTFEMNGLAAIQVSSSVSYGVVNLNEISEVQTVTVTQTGNVAADVQQTALVDALDCDGEGEVPLTKIKMDTDIAFDYSTEGVSFVGSTGAALLSDLDLSVRTDEVSPMTADIYLRLQMPSIGLRGVCSGTVTFLGVADS